MDNSKKMKKAGRTNTAITVICVIAIFAVFNLMLKSLSNKVQMTVDMTPNKLFVLSDETKNYLDTLNSDIKFYYMIEPGKESPYVTEVMERYEKYSKHISSENVDPVANPVFAAKYTADGETMQKGNIIVESEKRFTIVDPGTALTIVRDQNGNVTRSLGFVLEQKLTNAVDFVVRDKTVRVRYAAGHNAQSFSLPASKLKAENMEVAQTVLLDDELSAENTDLLILFGFRDDLSSEEVQKIDKYLSDGGRLFITVDPGVRPKNILAIAERYGITVEDNLLTEGNKGEIIADSALNLIAVADEHEICENLKKSRILFNSASALTISPKDGVSTAYLMKSKPSTKKCEIEDGDAGRKLDEGSFGLAAIGEIGKSRVFVASTSRFLTPDDSKISNILNFADYQNREFFVQSVKYLTDSEKMLVSVAPKNIDSRTLSLTNTKKFVYILLFGGVLPLAAFVTGFVIWFKRRNL